MIDDLDYALYGCSNCGGIHVLTEMDIHFFVGLMDTECPTCNGNDTLVFLKSGTIEDIPGGMIRAWAGQVRLRLND